ncbi:hypothetical protein EZS27_015876 [termite gut metagenome]|uniref:HTH cro/C1-type domain-containing protein n=1 Tax=termite gut metagenome TaxID=433724 RepID=A0A5J4RQN6_9ZZZZ
MIFINSIEILELQKYSVTEIDRSLIRKQKRKLFADIDLSDNGMLDYKGIYLTKTDCETAIEDLENSDYVEFYLYLANNNHLFNDFLVNGDESFFTKFSQESIYKLPDFVNFISPYFAPRFDKALLNAFTEFKSESVNSRLKIIGILQTQMLIQPTDINVAFKNLSVAITSRISQIEKIAQEIKKETTNYDDKNIDEIEDLVKDLFPSGFLNALPKYFQSQINKIAAAINQLQLAIWDTFNKAMVCRQLLGHLLSLNIESVGKQTFENNYKTVKQADERRKHIDKLHNILNSFESKAKTIANARELIYQAKPYLFNIKAITKETDITYIGLSIRVAFDAQNFVIEEVNKEQSSDNLSLQRLLGFQALKIVLKNAWEVTQLIGSLDLQNDFRINRYNPNKETLQNICNQLNVPTPQLDFGKIPLYSFVILDGEITHTDKDSKPLPITNSFIKKDVRYIGLNLKVEVFEYQSVKFHLKYIQPDGTLKTGTSSPEGFSFSNDTVIILNSVDI